MACMEDVLGIVSEIVSRYSPLKVIMFGKKVTVADDIKDIDLCIITETDNKRELEKDIYLNVDSPIPFDVYVYTPAEAEKLLGEPASFMSRIQQRGTVLYERKA